MDKSSICVQIGGQRYNIIAGGREEELRLLAADLDSRVNENMKMPGISYIQAVVLAALDCEDERRDALSAEEQLRNELRESLADAAHAQAERDRLKRENERLKSKLQKKETPDTLWQ